MYFVMVTNCFYVAMETLYHVYPSFPRLLLEVGASTTVPGSDGLFVHCLEYSGVQHLLETTRKGHLKDLVRALRVKKALSEFKRVWKVS